MRTAIFCFTDEGARLALKIRDILDIPRSDIHSTERFAEAYDLTPHVSVFDDMENLFYYNDALVFIGACGIAVRAIAPYIRDKSTDPAVLTVDAGGRFVIPLLSGHIGGANRLAKRIAKELCAAAVITTATDTFGRFSCDEWAARHGYAISSMDLAKAVSAAILTQDIPISSDYELPAELPEGLISRTDGELGIYIGTRITSPYRRTLRLIPRALNIGVGCRRGTSKDKIITAVKDVFHHHGLDIRAIKSVASADIKRDEEGILACADEFGAEALFFTADELNRVQGEFSESEFVFTTVGTGCVCERAAVLAGGDLIIKKAVLGGVTVAVAEEKRRLEF